MRPVVSSMNSAPQVLSTHLDYLLKQVVHLCPAYLCDSWQLLKELQSLGKMPPGARLITADAVAMYTNINTRHGIQSIKRWLQMHKKKNNLPAGYPIQFVVDGLKIVMKNNILQFGDTFWHQRNGTAMGTSSACMYATIYFSYHEETEILPPGKNRGILFYRRLIDDAFIIQLSSHKKEKYNDLVQALNNFGDDGSRLQWEVSQPAKHAVFLDLNLTIQDNGTIHTSTYVKPMNLHLYIPAHSAHSPGVLKSLIFGQLLRFWKQNSQRKDFIKACHDFYHHLRNRGYHSSTLNEQFLLAAERLSAVPTLTHSSSTQVPDLEKRIFFHVQYHPHSIPKQTIRDHYRTTCEQALLNSTNGNDTKLGINRLVIAYSRAPNLRDRLCRTKLPPTPGQDVSDILATISQKPASTST